MLSSREDKMINTEGAHEAKMIKFAAWVMWMPIRITAFGKDEFRYCCPECEEWQGDGHKEDCSLAGMLPGE